jgi:hypothetical protein
MVLRKIITSLKPSLRAEKKKVRLKSLPISSPRAQALINSLTWWPMILYHHGPAYPILAPRTLRLQEKSRYFSLEI